MKLFNLYFLLLSIFLLPGATHAAESTGLTRSAGKLVNDSSIELNDTLSDSRTYQSGQSKNRGLETTIETMSTPQYRTANHGVAVQFEIFDAWVELSGDINNDGFYHRIKTTFDADVNTAVETVYAKLYLSYEGGPWRQFADTDLFEIYYDSQNDTYEIITELIEGYPAGYYDVLIELHSFYHQGIVASRVITQDYDGYSITLQDLSHDDSYLDDEYYYEPEYHVAAGSFSWAGLILPGFLFIIKLRYFSHLKKAAPQRK